MQGFAVVILSKETKQRIRAPWVKALIVKVLGRTVGFHPALKIFDLVEACRKDGLRGPREGFLPHSVYSCGRL